MDNFLWEQSTKRLREQLEAIELPEYGVHNTKDKNKRGRPLAFPTPIAMLDAISSYFKAIDDNPYLVHDFVGKNADPVYRKQRRPYTWEGLCLYIGYNKEYFNKFEIELALDDFRGSEQFLRVITHARSIIYDNKFSGAASHIFSHHIIARDLGLADKKQIEGGDKPITLLGGDSLKSQDKTENKS